MSPSPRQKILILPIQVRPNTWLPEPYVNSAVKVSSSKIAEPSVSETIYSYSDEEPDPPMEVIEYIYDEDPSQPSYWQQPSRSNSRSYSTSYYPPPPKYLQYPPRPSYQRYPGMLAVAPRRTFGPDLFDNPNTAPSTAFFDLRALGRALGTGLVMSPLTYLSIIAVMFMITIWVNNQLVAYLYELGYEPVPYYETFRSVPRNHWPSSGRTMDDYINHLVNDILVQLSSHVLQCTMDFTTLSLHLSKLPSALITRCGKCGANKEQREGD